MDELDVQGAEPESNEPQRSGKALVFVAIVMGLAGVGLGVAGLVTANKVTRELAALRAELKSAPDPAENLRSEIKSVDDRLVNVGAETMRANNQLRSLRQEMNNALADMGSAVRSNREQINKHTATLAELADAATRRPAPVASTSAPASTTASSSGSSGGPDAAPARAESSGGGRVHVIEAGDSFSKLATRYGVTLQRIIDANPSANPNRLQIGQEIVIP